jgi:acetyl-CoA carboxylase biotin carboxylase subunit
MPNGGADLAGGRSQVFESVLVANRGEIARRIMRTAARLNIKTVAVYSEADAGLPFVREATESVLLGPSPPAQSYLNIPAVLEAAAQTDAEAIHPGYGFLAENADFATAVLEAGLIWIGPSPDAIAQMGDKVKARNLMTHAGVPVMPGSTEAVVSVDSALEQAAEIGYPVMVKAVAGGGGIGMGAARNAEELRSVFETARTRAERFFANPAVLLERFVTRARHVEVQILGLTDGRVVTLGERDCSVQRRHQKLVEETPSPGLPVEVRERMLAAATRAGEAVDYRSAGTVEFLVDRDRPGEFYFLEMNTRLQVEHPITELVTGVDLVEQQFLIASGEPVSFDPDQLARTGHAIEMRIYAEDPVRFLPGPGTISRWREPTGEGIRVDAGYTEGDTVTPFYDPLLAKLCAWGPDRDSALRRAASATAEFVVEGPKCNLPLFGRLLVSDQFVSGVYDTGLIADLPPRPV